MEIDLPKCHNLRNNPDLRETGFYLRTWEISVPHQDSFEWSVVLSHLTSSHLRNEEDFTKRLSDLTDDLDHLFDVKKCISSFNPFLNRFSCFYNKRLQKVVTDFKSKLQGTEDIVEKFEATCLLLKCHMIVITTTQTGDVMESFPKNGEIPAENPRITLYCKSKSPLLDTYNFGLKREQGNTLKQAAFNKILKEANIHKKRRRSLFLLDNEKESFVTSVLKSDFKSSIPYLYRSSYIAWKLAEAGFEMDPKSPDSNGFSSFYHALATGNEPVIYILHNYAANGCHQSDKNVRDPDKFIFDNIIKLGEIIEKDREKSNNFHFFGANDNTVKQNANQLIRFNNFLTQMCQQIMDANKNTNVSEPSDVLEATSRRDILIIILQIYDSFFFFEENVRTDIFSRLNYYCIYSNYYRNLDYSATLYFFDNIFSLKERLQMDNNEYSELESNFFLSVLSNKFFSCDLFTPSSFSHKSSPYEKNFNVCRNYILESPEKERFFKIIPLIERMCLRRKMRHFVEILSEITIDSKNVVCRLPEEEIPKILASLPEVKDELEIRRLMYYLETAMEQKVNSPKQVLVVERALQVLGEFVKSGRKSPSSLCFLISVCLPENIFRTIKQTRNILSHLKEYSFSSKLKAEKNTSLFHNIKEDIAHIYRLFKVVFDMQHLRLAEFLFKRGLEHIENILLREKTEVREKLSEVLFQLKEEYNKLCKIKSKPCFNNTIFQNPNFLTNISDIINEALSNEETWNKDALENCKRILWPLKYLLTLIAKDCEKINFNKFEKLISCSENILLCDSSEIRERFEEFWEKYKVLIAEARFMITSDKSQVEHVGENIEIFKKSLKGFSIFSKSEEECILSQIPQSVHDSIYLRNEIQRTLESGQCLTVDQIKAMPILFLSKRQMKILKENYQSNPDTALEIVKSASDPIRELNDIFEKGSICMKKEAFVKLCNRLKFPEDVKNKLNHLMLGEKKIPLENHLFNLLNRIKLLREILIEENSSICELWNKAKHVKTQQYAKYKIVQRFTRDPDVQASVEMLLFDCMHLLGKKTDIESLWIKASSLFNGVNLRNVLGHGHPTLETIGKLLDPNDLPSVLVEEMLRLIKDESVIKAMYELSVQTKSDFGKFHEIMNDEEDIKFAEIRNHIRHCDRWQRYSYLLNRENYACQDETGSSKLDLE